MANLKLVEALTPEDWRRRCRESCAEAEKRHHYRRAEAEREFAHEILSAEATRKAAIENAPKVYGSSDSSNGAFPCACDKAIEAAEAAYRKAHAVAEDLRIRAIERSREVCGNEIGGAKEAFRNSPGWLGSWP